MQRLPFAAACPSFGDSLIWPPISAPSPVCQKSRCQSLRSHAQQVVSACGLRRAMHHEMPRRAALTSLVCITKRREASLNLFTDPRPITARTPSSHPICAPHMQLSASRTVSNWPPESLRQGAFLSEGVSKQLMTIIEVLPAVSTLRSSVTFTAGRAAGSSRSRPRLGIITSALRWRLNHPHNKHGVFLIEGHLETRLRAFPNPQGLSREFETG